MKRLAVAALAAAATFAVDAQPVDATPIVAAVAPDVAAYPLCYTTLNRAPAVDNMQMNCSSGTGYITMRVWCRTTFTVDGNYLYGSRSRTVYVGGPGTWWLYCPSDRPYIQSGSIS